MPALHPRSPPTIRPVWDVKTQRRMPKYDMAAVPITAQPLERFTQSEGLVTRGRNHQAANQMRLSLQKIPRMVRRTNRISSSTDTRRFCPNVQYLFRQKLLRA